MQQAHRVYEVACHVFREAGCPEPLLAEVTRVEPEVALLGALYKRLWDLEWDSGDWPGDFVLMQPGRSFDGCKEFGLGLDAEALTVWLSYARQHIGEMQDMLCSFLAKGLTESLPALRKRVGEAAKPQRRQQWRGGVAV